MGVHQYLHTCVCCVCVCVYVCLCVFMCVFLTTNMHVWALCSGEHNITKLFFCCVRVEYLY